MENNTPPLPPEAVPKTSKEKGGNNYLIYIVGGLTVLILVIGGVFVYKNLAKYKSANVSSGSASQYPSLESLDNELSSLDDSPVNSDFTELDKDLQSL